MEVSKISNESQSTSVQRQRSRIGKFFIYSAAVVLYLAVVSPSILPTYLYFLSEKPERGNLTTGKYVHRILLNSNHTALKILLLHMK